MWAAVYFWLLVFYPASLPAQTAAVSISDLHADSQEDNRVGPAHSSDRKRGPGALRQRAEAAFQRAGALRDKHTAKDLMAAAGTFRSSAELFREAGSYERAADAYLQAGDIDSTLSQYERARGSYREVLRLEDPEKRCKALSRIARTYKSGAPLI